MNFALKGEVLAFQEIQAESMPVLNLPHPGYLSTRFSAFHPGIDIATGFGMPIHPITEGIVEEIQFGFWGLGNYIVISHPSGLRSTYGHTGRIFVKKDQVVSQNTTLGTVGMSGATSGPHTHLEIDKDGKLIDPTTILPKLDEYPKIISNQAKLSKTLKLEF